MIKLMMQFKFTNSFIFLLFSFIAYFVVIFVTTRKSALDCVPKYLHKYLQFKEKYKNVNNTVEIKSLGNKIEKWNENSLVMNWQVYGPVDSDTTVVVIRVHRDLERLQYLVASLAQVSDIHTVLLIFSHSFYDEIINHLVQEIDYCMVMQIFYPNTVQLFPNNFPGIDPEDCTIHTRDNTTFCIDRDARLTETKHHWWWTANFVFNQVAWKKIYQDMVIFIDEDSYVLPDLLYMFGVLKRTLALVSDASVLSFGRPLATDLDNNKIIVEAWRPPFDNGLAFNKTIWQQISTLRSLYCQYDDTSWSYSLMHLFEQFPQGRAVMLACMAPRVVSTGVFRSGSHALENICHLTKLDRLFPKTIQAVLLFGFDGKLQVRTHMAPPIGNGGWSDQRDRLLCFDPLTSTPVESEFTITPSVSTIDQPLTT